MVAFFEKKKKNRSKAFSEGIINSLAQEVRLKRIILEHRYRGLPWSLSRCATFKEKLYTKNEFNHFYHKLDVEYLNLYPHQVNGLQYFLESENALKLFGINLPLVCVKILYTNDEN